MTTQDSDSVKAIKALEGVEKHLQDVITRVQRGARWAWQQDGVTYIDVFGFQDVTNRAGKAIEDAAPLFEVYLHALGKVPPRFKAVFEQAAALMDWVRSLKYQHEAEYSLVRGLQSLQRVAFGLLDDQEQKRKQPTKSKQNSGTDAANKLDALTGIYQKLQDKEFIVNGRWAGSPACFWTLAYELNINHEIDNGGLAWADVARWVGVPADEMDKLIHSAQVGYYANKSKKARGQRAAELRIICQK
jgi:hypothetical protein